jgi:PIN domain nuclease of toxin-antitoxin system
VRLLLDTHSLLWYTLGEPRLSSHAHDLIADASNEVLVSPASYWEIAIKVSIGRLALHTPYEEFINACFNRYQFVNLPINPRHTAHVATLPFPRDHRDPFDRLLVAQCLVDGIPMVSADTRLDVYRIQRMW